MAKRISHQERRMAEYFDLHTRKLELLKRMWADPRVQCYNDSELPDRSEICDLGSAFLVGPTSRHQILMYNWRCEAVAYLREARFEGFIYVPEPRELEKSKDFTDREYIHYWESDRLFGSNLITGAFQKVVWIPREADELLGLNTNLEFGIILGKLMANKGVSLFAGWPDEAERMGLTRHYSTILQGVRRYDTLRRLCFAVTHKVPPEDVGIGQ